jgi:hypothetical protein
MAVNSVLRKQYERGVGLYSQAVSITTAVSDDYKLPIGVRKAIGCRISGTGTIAFTFDDHATIDAGTAVWADWDGTSQVNLAVTGFRVTRSAGTVAAFVTLQVVEGA